VVTWVAVKGVPRGRSSRPLTGPHVSSSSSWERSETQFSGASFVSGFGFFVRSQKRADQRLVPIRFSRFCLRPPLLPGFYPHSQGATVGPVHVGVRSQTRPHHHRDEAWLVGCCHLIGDLQGSGHFPQSPEQGEWMSLLQTFPITNRPPRHQSIFCSPDSFFRDCVVLTFELGLCCHRFCCPASCPRVA